MRGFKYFAGAPVGPNGEELTPAQQVTQQDNCQTPTYTGNCRVRFDGVRNGIFHHVLYAHARAKPKSLPCLDSDGDAIPFDDAGDCNEDENPAFNPINYHVPSSTSGIAHLPGSSVLIALGGWDTTNFVGTRFMQVSTTVHELGHNIGLYTGGLRPSGAMRRRQRISSRSANRTT